MYHNSCIKLSLLLCLQFAVVKAFSAGYSQYISSACSSKIMSGSLPADSVARLWIEDLRLFRDAVYKNDTATVKRFFKFPLEGDVWFLVLPEKELQSNSNKKKWTAFTEKDFNRYYQKIFSTRFVKAFLKVKSEELYQKSDYETIEIRESATSTYKMQASFDEEERKLTLYLNFTSIEKDEQGEIIDGGEGTVIYVFRVLKNGHLQFEKIMMAG